MAEILKLPFSESQLSSMTTVPIRWVSLDLEYLKDEVSGKSQVIEVALWDIISDQKIFRTLVRPKNPNLLSSWRKERGYSVEALLHAPEMHEVDRILQYLLQNCMLVLWNQEFDLMQYPALRTHSFGIRDCMKRYSSAYGPWDPVFGNRRYLKLGTAADQIGFQLDEDECFHCALADAKATAALWRFCDTQDLPCYQIPRDLVLKDEVSLIIEGFQNNLQEEIEAEISEFTEDEDSENDDSEDVPF